MLTEQQNPRSHDIDQNSTLDMLHVINDEDATVAQVVREALPSIAQAVDAITAGLRNGGRLIYVGAGTSGRLGMLDAVELVPTFSVSPDLVVALVAGGHAALTQSIENAEDNREMGRADLLALNITPHDTVVGIAASGRTPYVLAALEAANETGCTTIGISCNVPSALLDLASIKIGLPVGPEVITGSTRLKAGTAQKMVLNLISTTTMVNLGKVYGNLMVDVRVTNAKLADRARRIVMQITGVDEQEASRLLEQTGNDVKTAIVMQRLNLSADEARQKLQQHNGRLREVIA